MRLLNGKRNTANALGVNKKYRNTKVKVRFSSPASIAGLGIRAGQWATKWNPSYVHVNIKYQDRRGRHHKRSLIRKPKWGHKRFAELKLWVGLIHNVYEVDYLMNNNQRANMWVNELTFYHQKGHRLPRIIK
jgi:hypothetical protein